MRPVTIIAACDVRWGIGRDGGIPWRNPEDMARFRARTMGATVVMGVRTVASLPVTLAGRTVLSVSASGRGDYRSVTEACLSAPDDVPVFAAGGAGVYWEALRFATEADITRIDGDWDCDVRMPNLEAEGWKLAGREALGVGAMLELWRPTR